MYLNIFLFALFSVAVNHVSCDRHVVCYYGTWATYRWSLGKFDVDDINTDLCTHLVYTFVGINNVGKVVSLDSYLDLPDNWGRNNFGKFNDLKKKNSNLKTLLAVGGWNEGSAKYSTMAASPTLRKTFVTSALEMVLTYGFNGLDIDWEYPNRRDSTNGRADIDNFTQLLKELREEFDKHGLLLTAAVSAVKDMASLSYDIPAISKYLDIINLMTYDMYGSWDSVTGHNSPLHKGQGDELAAKESIYSVDVAVEYWLAQGCPPEKLVLGIPFYGRTFILRDPTVYSVRAPSSGPGIAGPYTATNGNIGYNEFCSLLQSESWNVYYDDLAMVPFAVRNQNWVSFDNPASITKKVEFSLEKNLAGVMVWSIETDDFHGTCHGEDFPLLRAINKALKRDQVVTETPSSTSTSTTTTTPTTTTTATTPVVTETTTSSTPATTLTSTTPEPATTETEQESNEQIDPNVCKTEGITADPSNCTQFLVCVVDGSGNLLPVVFHCPAGLFWDQNFMFCNYADAVNCTVE